MIIVPSMTISMAGFRRQLKRTVKLAFTMGIYLKQNSEDSGMQFNTWFNEVSLRENQSLGRKTKPRVSSKLREMYATIIRDSRKQKHFQQMT